jgi:hypothetical protein
MTDIFHELQGAIGESTGDRESVDRVLSLIESILRDQESRLLRLEGRAPAEDGSIADYRRIKARWQS